MLPPLVLTYDVPPLRAHSRVSRLGHVDDLPTDFADFVLAVLDAHHALSPEPLSSSQWKRAMATAFQHVPQVIDARYVRPGGNTAPRLKYEAASHESRDERVSLEDAIAAARSLPHATVFLGVDTAHPAVVAYHVGIVPLQDPVAQKGIMTVLTDPLGLSPEWEGYAYRKRQSDGTWSAPVVQLDKYPGAWTTLAWAHRSPEWDYSTSDSGERRVP